MIDMKKMTTIIISSILLFNLLLIFFATASCEEINTNTFYVGGSNEGNYSSIQEAINASSDGDTIFIYAGIYNETIVVNKSICLIGENKETTIINGNNNSDFVVWLFYKVNITGFTIQEGPLFGILIDGNGYCNTFQNDIKKNRIGIYVSGSINSNIFNNTISSNSEIGLEIENSSNKFDILMSENNTIYHNNFINNSQHTNDASNNFWSYNNEGNYYDDYTEFDKNNDGIGDEPYKILGGSNVDEYPLMMPYSGTIKLKEFYIDDESLYTMLIVGMVVAVLFCLPIAYVWYRKYYKVK